MGTKLSKREAILNNLQFAFDTLDYSKPLDSQLDDFLTSIKMSTDEIIRQSFFIAVYQLEYEHITNTYIQLELRKKFPGINKVKLRNFLLNEFKEWLLNYPELDAIYPKLSFSYFLKVFSKQFKES